MKLSDFINTDKEEHIMRMINKTHEDWRATIFLHLSLIEEIVFEASIDVR